jgi:hypothetical protein
VPDLSVIIPLYGEHRGRSSLRQVTAAWLAQDVPCEVVLATAGDIPVEVAEDIDEHRAVRVVRAPVEDTAPGRLRNFAVEHARSAMLYLSDADVAPLGRDYVGRAVRLAAAGVMVQPWMYRLGGGPEALSGRLAVDCRPVGSGTFCYVGEGSGDGGGGGEESARCLPALGGEQVVWKARAYGELRRLTPRVLPPPRSRVNAPQAAQRWRAPYHWGGMLIIRHLFESVGGYCPQYVGWGNEDDDLLIKVEGRAVVRRGWQLDRSLSCLHFEHPTTHELTSQRSANAALFATRLAVGPDAMIKQDCAARITTHDTEGAVSDL